jgi:hypothetical protein
LAARGSRCLRRNLQSAVATKCDGIARNLDLRASVIATVIRARDAIEIATAMKRKTGMLTNRAGNNAKNASLHAITRMTMGAMKLSRRHKLHSRFAHPPMRRLSLR